ncbi:MAG: hypothetical protein LBT51_03445 [Fusobacteriaceae bacterium]|jgi:predicted Fe-Mo cluster-binding NifX family protein|nr:hypothetical protein [Fusobacteriaceae bacterium]
MAFIVAVATSNGVDIDTHFGQAKELSVYTVNDDETYELRKKVSISEYVGSCGNGGCGNFNDSVQYQKLAELIDSAQYLLVKKIGKHPYMYLQRFGVTAIEAPSDLSIAIKKLIKYHNKTKHNNY